MSLNPRRETNGSDSEFQSSHLWVGNLPFDISESELMALFEKHGDIDGITRYASRSYAFVYYRHVEDAVAAKDALQGFVLNGNTIKIEFAKPAKPSKHVWVGGFSSAVTKEKLEEELSKFGKIEDFKFITDRNSALVDFARLEDASAAVKNSNGLQIGDDYIRVDFLRSHPARREQTDLNEMGDTQFRTVAGFNSSWINPDLMRSYYEPTYSGHKRLQPSQPIGARKGDNPSKVLWVGYPSSVVLDEEMLHNAMILYGEIERVSCIPGRNFSFVEFRSIEEARRAKEALQGRLFNDPRIIISFSNSSLPAGKDSDPKFSGFRGQRTGMFGNKAPFQPHLMDMFPHMTPNSFSGTNGRFGQGLIRPFGPRGNFDPLLPTPDLHDPSMHSAISDLHANISIGMNQRNLSPSAAGLLPSPALSGRSGYKTSGWDVLDPSYPARDSKRSRTDGPTIHDISLIASQSDEHVDQPNGSGPPFEGRVSAEGHAQGRAIDDYVWRGVIAKGGNHVCHARCIPMGKELEFDMPEVVNCSARTGLDMLAKHYADAIGFNIVFFLPDSEDDFANYTDFLRYLGSKDRAGVAKLDDGTTLFLVPPSTFLTDVLKVTGQERLYGVVLKMQPTQLNYTPPHQFHQPLPSMLQTERPVFPPALNYAVPKSDYPVQTEYCTSGPQAAIPLKTSYPTVSAPQLQSNETFSSVSAHSLSLTPELIASLQLMRSAAQSSAAQNSQLSSSTTSHSWNQQQTGQATQQYGNQPYPNAPLANNFPSFPTPQNYNHPLENMPIQNHVYNPAPPVSHPVTAQAQQFLPVTQGSQSYPIEVPRDVQQGSTMMHPTPTGSYNVADNQQPYNPGSYLNQSYEGNSSHLESNLSGSVGNSNAEPRSSVPSEVGQGNLEAEVEKNQRYQSTLQFAANLLLQIQQQQQQQQQGGSSMGNQQ